MCTDSAVALATGAPGKEIEVTPEMIEAAMEAIEDCRFTSMEGYDLLRAIPLVFKAMTKRREESRS